MKKTLASCMTCLLVLGTFAVVAGCGGGNGGSGGGIEDVTWVLDSYRLDGTMTDVPPDMRIDAVFAAGRVSGFSGVNTYWAAYEVSGSSLTIDMPASTMMAGPEPLMAVEQAYLSALQEAASFTATQDELVVFADGGGDLLTYTKEEAPPLTGVTWQVTGYNNGRQAVVSLIEGSELNVVFSEDGTVSGSSGVNTFSGSYTVDGGRISIGPLATTLMAGDPALMEQEAAFLAALESVSAYGIRGSELELRSEDGALAVTCTQGS